MHWLLHIQDNQQLSKQHPSVIKSKQGGKVWTGLKVSDFAPFFIASP